MIAPYAPRVSFIVCPVSECILSVEPHSSIWDIWFSLSLDKQTRHCSVGLVGHYTLAPNSCLHDPAHPEFEGTLRVP